MRAASGSPSPLKRHNSTPVACCEKSEKFVPLPIHVAPSGYGQPRHTRVGADASVVLGTLLRETLGSRRISVGSGERVDVVPAAAGESTSVEAMMLQTLPRRPPREMGRLPTV